MRAKIHKPQEASPSILQSKILNFDNIGSSTNRCEIGSPIPTCIPAWGTTPSEQAHTTQDPNETFITPNNKDTGNFVDNNIFTTYSMDPDTSLSPIMAKKLQQLRQMIFNVHGVVQHILEVSPTSYRISRLVPVITDTEVPKHFQTPNMKPYDGTTNPEEHVA